MDERTRFILPINLAVAVLVVSISSIFIRREWMLDVEQSHVGYSGCSYGSVALLAAAPQLNGRSAFNCLLRYLHAAFVAVTTLGEPVGFALRAYIFLKETPTPAIMAGGVFVLFGTNLTSRRKNDNVVRKAAGSR